MQHLIGRSINCWGNTLAMTRTSNEGEGTRFTSTRFHEQLKTHIQI